MTRVNNEIIAIQCFANYHRWGDVAALVPSSRCTKNLQRLRRTVTRLFASGKPYAASGLEPRTLDRGVPFDTVRAVYVREFFSAEITSVGPSSLQRTNPACTGIQQFSFTTGVRLLGIE